MAFRIHLVLHRLVALRKESVDRNIRADVSYNIKETSLSARRAWIEILPSCGKTPANIVALRKESVDRNLLFGLSSMLTSVALRKESVDRNVRCRCWVLSDISRSPQGERG